MTLAKASQEAKAGREMEAQCPKCQRKTTHVIKSVQGGQPKQIQCLTCEHRYVYKPGEAEAKVAESKTSESKATESKATESKATESKTTESKASGSGAASKADSGSAAKTKAPASPVKPPHKPLGEVIKSPSKAKTVKPVGPPEAPPGDVPDSPRVEPPKGTSQKATSAKPASKATKAASEPKPVKETKESKEEREAKEAQRLANEELEAHKANWLTLKAKIGLNHPVKYDLSGEYSADQLLIHEKFGQGFIMKVVQPNKIEVQFEEFKKLLVMRVGSGK